MLETLEPRWDGPIVVAATGPSLKKFAQDCQGYPTLALKQACIKMPWAEVLYACDDYHWEAYSGYPQFKGEKWSTHNPKVDNKLIVAEKYKLRLVQGEMIRSCFSTNPSIIHYGPVNSLFQLIGFAIHWLKKPGRIVLIGAEFHGGFFFGRHPRTNRDVGSWDGAIPGFNQAAKTLPPGVEIVNATPDSKLKCFPMMPLKEALSARKAA